MYGIHFCQYGYTTRFSIKSILRNSLLPFRVILSFYKTNSLINDFKPDIVVGTGGYASALPLFVASKYKKGISIILQEQKFISWHNHKMVFEES